MIDSAVPNIFSVDLEDWHALVRRRVTGTPLSPPTPNVLRQTDRLLRLLDRYGVKATFFTLGSLAAHRPRLVQRIAQAGHEIACHSYSHDIVYQLTPEAFREDTRRAKETLEDVTGAAVVGYRAPEFSLNEQSLWALDVLAELGFEYDSSIFPIRHRRYGIAGFDPAPKRYALPRGGGIVEVPLSTVALGGARLPVAGGGYFRYLPTTVIKRAARRLHAQGRPLVTYFHPYEFDTRRLDIFEHLKPSTWKMRARGLLFNMHQNVGRASLANKVAALLGTFPFTTFQDYLARVRIGESSRLLPPHR